MSTLRAARDARLFGTENPVIALFGAQDFDRCPPDRCRERPRAPIEVNLIKAVCDPTPTSQCAIRLWHPCADV
jgi:hypothetical protein